MLTPEELLVAGTAIYDKMQKVRTIDVINTYVPASIAISTTSKTNILEEILNAIKEHHENHAQVLQIIEKFKTDARINSGSRLHTVISMVSGFIAKLPQEQMTDLCNTYVAQFKHVEGYQYFLEEAQKNCANTPALTQECEKMATASSSSSSVPAPVQSPRVTINGLQEIIHTLEEELSTNHAELSRILTVNTNLENENDELRKHIKLHSSSLADIKKEVSSLGAALKNERETVLALKKELTDAQQALAKATQDPSASSSKSSGDLRQRFGIGSIASASTTSRTGIFGTSSPIVYGQRGSNTMPRRGYGNGTGNS